MARFGQSKPARFAALNDQVIGSMICSLTVVSGWIDCHAPSRIVGETKPFDNKGKHGKSNRGRPPVRQTERLKPIETVENGGSPSRPHDATTRLSTRRFTAMGSAEGGGISIQQPNLRLGPQQRIPHSLGSIARSEQVRLST
jgi:hypothetical protein